MSFDHLPNECLWKIFDNFANLEELIQLTKVCSKWCDLISVRLGRVKYLHICPKWFDSISPRFSRVKCLLAGRNEDHPDYTKIRIKDPETIEDHNLQELLPNLKIFNTTFIVSNMNEMEETSALRIAINGHRKIKGLVGQHIKSFKWLNLDNIEMIALFYLEEYEKVLRPNQLKQIHLRQSHMVHLQPLVEHFPNLIRLNVSFKGGPTLYEGPSLSNLKILEISAFRYAGHFDLFHLLDFCPSLESAFISNPRRDNYVDMSIKNYNLRDLVIEIPRNDDINWQFLRKLLNKYPNLVHLAIRSSAIIDDIHVHQIVKMLPKIRLLDFRRPKVSPKMKSMEPNGYLKVTSRSADFLSKYCHKFSRSIEIYYDCKKEPTEWPRISTHRESICYQFNFMKHCFYKRFFALPDLIDE